MKKHIYISIFSGCGGLSLGFKNSKQWQGLFAIEKNSDAFKTLNFNLILNGHYSWVDWLPKTSLNIKDVLKNNKSDILKLRNQIDLVAGGPPCQGFSMAGKRQEKDSRNLLINSYIEFIKLLQPKIIFFENVKGFTQLFNKNGTKKVIYSEYIFKALSKKTKTFCGYSLDSKLVNFADFGVPQRRTRFIMVGIRKDLNQEYSIKKFFHNLYQNKQEFLDSKNLSPQMDIQSAISDLVSKKIVTCPDSSNFYSSKYGRAETNYQKYLRRNYTKDIPNSHRLANHQDKTIERFSYIIKNCVPGKNISDKTKKLFVLNKRNITLLSANDSSPTLTTLPDDFIHYKEPRILSVREYARIQSFDDCFEFKGKYTTGGKLRKTEVPRYTQVGNAIPPLFSEISAIELSKLL